MTAQTILPANSVTDTGYEITNSCRFNPGDNPKMVKASASSGNGYKGTFSLWVKRSNLGAQQMIGQQDTGHARVFFNGANQLRCYGNSAGEDNAFDLASTALFRDVGAWYHIVFAWDNTQSTASNRNKVYVNGVQLTDFATETYNPQNTQIGGGFFLNSTNLTISEGDDDDFNGYMTEIVGIENTTYGPTDFGEFDDSGIWKPIDGLEDLTFGPNGFYLDFEDSANLGNDVNGGTDFTESNLAAIDQSTDTPTNNFATLNSLDNFFAGSTFAEGNCKLTYLAGTGKYSYNTGTIALTSGKWYHEVKIAQSVGSNYNMFGIEEDVCQSTGHEFLSSSTGYVLNGNNGKIIVTGTDTTYGDATAVNDIIGVYVDLDNNKIYFAENGTVMNSGTGQTIAAVSATKYGYYFVIGGDYSSGTVGIHEFNFGGSPAFTISSGNTDDNGYGNFEYSPNITGDSVAKKFYAICTKNLAEYG